MFVCLGFLQRTVLFRSFTRPTIPKKERHPPAPRDVFVLASWTEYVGSRWYRAPEMLAGSTDYGAAVDVWACACLATEMSSGRPLFPGEDEGELVRAFGWG